MLSLQQITDRAIAGIAATVDEALGVAERYTLDEICDAAHRVRMANCPNPVDTCSIVNARSGRCGEDCKWCAQSAHHKSHCDIYDAIGEEEMMRQARSQADAGTMRFSLVTSGRRVAGKDIKLFCRYLSRVGRETSMHLCASMGLLDRDELQALRDAGVTRYHCNLETSRRYFSHLCTTHTYDDKLRTIAIAREVGLEVCSGGIIGMGETMADRLEMARDAVEAGAVSIPVNILNPIPGTPLQDTPLISEEEIALSVALMRLVAPKATLRFAGGRMRLSPAMTRRILLGGMNGALVGDMLTTVGNTVESDKKLFSEIEGK